MRSLLKIEESNPHQLDKDIRVWKLPDGSLHRKFGPAIEYSDGSEKWYLNGKPHRVDGPALILPSGVKMWYIEGNQLSEEEFNSLTK